MNNSGRFSDAGRIILLLTVIVEVAGEKPWKREFPTSRMWSRRGSRHSSHGPTIGFEEGGKEGKDSKRRQPCRNALWYVDEGWTNNNPVSSVVTSKQESCSNTAFLL